MNPTASPKYNPGSPNIHQRQYMTEQETMHSTKTGSQNSPDKILRQKILQMSDGKVPSKFNGINFQKCDNFDEEVIDPQQVIKRSNKGLCMRQGINGILQFIIILFNCIYVKEGEFIYCTFAFVIGCISQWLLIQIHMDKYFIQQINELQRKRVNISKSPKKNLKDCTTSGKKVYKSNSNNVSKLCSNDIRQQQQDEMKISKPALSFNNSPKAQNNSFKVIPQIELIRRKSSLINKTIDEIYNQQNNNVNNKQNQSFNKQGTSLIKENSSSQNKRRSTSMIGVTINSKGKQSRLSSVQPSPKNAQNNLNILSTNRNSSINIQSIRNNKNIQSINFFNKHSINSNNEINFQKNIIDPSNNQANNIQLQMAIVNADNQLKEELEKRRSTVQENEMKTPIRRRTIRKEQSITQSKSQQKRRRKRKSTKRNYQNDEMTVLKASNWYGLLGQLNYQWIQYLINILPLITIGIKDQNTLRDILLLQLLRGVFLLDAIVSYQKVDLTHQYSKYARYYLHVSPFNFVTAYLFFIIMFFSYIYYIIEDSLYLWDSIWNIIVSITTIGYGDIVPITNAGRVLIIVSSNLGYIFLSFIASLIQSSQEFAPKEQTSFDDARLQAKYLQNLNIIQNSAAIVIQFHFKNKKRQQQNKNAAVTFENLENQVHENNNQNIQDNVLQNNVVITFNDDNKRREEKNINNNKDLQNINIEDIENQQKVCKQKSSVENKRDENKQDSKIVYKNGNTNNHSIAETIFKTFTQMSFTLKENRKNKCVQKIRKFFEEQNREEHHFVNKLQQQSNYIRRLINKSQDSNSLNENRQDLNQTLNRQLSTANTRKKESIVFPYDFMTPRQLSQRRESYIKPNISESQESEMDKAKKNILLNIQQLNTYHKEIRRKLEEIEQLTLLNQNCDCNDTRSNFDKSKIELHSNHNQSNSLLDETPKQTPKNIPSMTNIKTMTFQAATNRSLNTCETPMNNNVRLPQPFMVKYSNSDEENNTSDNCSKLLYNRECQGDLDNQQIENSELKEQLIEFNQSQDLTPISNNEIKPQIFKFSSCTDNDLTSFKSKVYLNREFVEDLDKQSIQIGQQSKQLILFNESPYYTIEELSRFTEENKRIISQQRVELSNDANQLQDLQKNIIKDKQDESYERRDKLDVNQEIFERKNRNEQMDEDEDNKSNSFEIEKSDIYRSSMLTYNQISAPPSALPTAKFIKKGEEKIINNLDEEEFSDNIRSQSLQKQFQDNHLLNSNIAGFTDKYLKSNPKFLQEINCTSQTKTKQITKVRKFSMDSSNCQQKDGQINTFNNNHQLYEEQENFECNHHSEFYNEAISKRDVPILQKRNSGICKQIISDFQSNPNNSIFSKYNIN